MAYRDLRDYVATLEKHGKLKRVTKQVDKDWEIAAVCRQLFKKIPPGRLPAGYALKTSRDSISQWSRVCSAPHVKSMPLACKRKR